MKYLLLAVLLSGCGLKGPLSYGPGLPHVRHASCSPFSRFVSEDELWTNNHQNDPVTINSPNGEVFESLSVDDDLGVSPVYVKWSGDPSGGKFIPSSEGTDSWWQITASTWVSVQQTLDDYQNGPGVEVNASVCPAP
jgi:hypothetical protein